MPKGEGFLRRTRQIFAGILGVFQGNLTKFGTKIAGLGVLIISGYTLFGGTTNEFISADHLTQGCGGRYSNHFFTGDFCGVQGA